MVEKPKDVTVKEGESARFECSVSGMPTPVVTWYFLGKPISENEIYKLECSDEGRTHALYLPEVFVEDAGLYTVNVRSDTGMAEASAFLNVEGEQHGFLLLTNTLRLKNFWKLLNFFSKSKHYPSFSMINNSFGKCYW